MPSRFKTASPPSLPTMPATCGETTPSIAAASSGSSKRYGPRVHVMSMSSGSRVRRDGTIAMSSKPYARRPFLPRPISTSMAATLRSAADGNLTLAARSGPVREPKTRNLRQLRTGRQSRLRQPLDLHVVEQPLYLARVEHAGPEVLDRLGAAGHGEAQAVRGGAPAVARRDHAREEGVTGPDRRAGLHDAGIDQRRIEGALVTVARECEAAGRQGHKRFARAELDDLVHRLRAIGVVGELVAHQLLRLGLVRRHEAGLCARAEPQRLPLGVQYGEHAEPVDLGDQGRVQLVGDPAREAAGEDAHGGALREVEELVHEQLELALGDGRAALVDLGLVAGGGIHHGGRGARLLPDAHEVVEDRLVGQLLDYARAGGPACDAS